MPFHYKAVMTTKMNSSVNIYVDTTALNTYYQTVTNSAEIHWNRGMVLFVSSRNKMYPIAQDLEFQCGRRQVKSSKAGELTGSFRIKLHLT
jgi:hypothetical protein